MRAYMLVVLILCLTAACSSTPEIERGKTHWRYLGGDGNNLPDTPENLEQAKQECLLKATRDTPPGSDVPLWLVRSCMASKGWYLFDEKGSFAEW